MYVVSIHIGDIQWWIHQTFLNQELIVIEIKKLNIVGLLAPNTAFSATLPARLAGLCCLSSPVRQWAGDGCLSNLSPVRCCGTLGCDFSGDYFRRLGFSLNYQLLSLVTCINPKKEWFNSFQQPGRFSKRTGGLACMGRRQPNVIQLGRTVARWSCWI